MADFLINSAGQIVDRAHGAHSSDQWSVDDLLKLAR
jgi:hypothetical protein